MQVTDYSKILHKGKEHGIKGAQLAYMVGFRNTSELRKDLKKSRAAGQIICSSTKYGYYLPQTRDEIREYVRTIEKHAKSSFKSLHSARESLKQVEGQENLDDF